MQTRQIIDARPCSAADFGEVKQHIATLCLDDINLEETQFLTAYYENKLAGFVRLRKYNSCEELCSLGVLENFRLRGIGSRLVNEVFELSTKPLFVVTVIPEFFKRFGFRETTTYPYELNYKLNYCISSLAAPEPYVVMVWK